MNAYYRSLCREISRFSKFFDQTIVVDDSNRHHQDFLESLGPSSVRVVESISTIGNGETLSDQSQLLILNGTLNYNDDIQSIMSQVYSLCSRNSRVAVVAYNSYFKPLYQLANFIRLRRGKVPANFVTLHDYQSVAKLCGFELVKKRHLGLLPIGFLFIDRLLNWLSPIIPFSNFFCLSTLLVFRPLKKSAVKSSLSIIVPARNEQGNVEAAITRVQNLSGIDLEIIFIEGHSKDDTWAEIQRMQSKYQGQFQIKAYQQTGKGKNDAVRLGFEKATKDLLVIQDADLTAEPEFILRFYNAYMDGHGDFINGNRLSLPMENEAMRPLNRLGNIFFAKALSFVLGMKLGDSLCGTKMISRKDHQRIISWRQEFGDFDPFGDFELLFGAAELCLGTVDVPVLYKARSYGSTNISRWSHGFMLLKMTTIGLFKIKLNRV